MTSFQRTLFRYFISYFCAVGTMACAVVKFDDSPQRSPQWAMRADVTRMKTVDFRHRWAIEQFSLSPVGEFIKSNHFGSEDGKYQFVLKLFPNGVVCRGHLSLSLEVKKCPPGEQKCRVNFIIETDEVPISLNRDLIIISKGGEFEELEFFDADMLKHFPNEYMPDDRLTVAVSVTVYGHSCNEVSVEDDILASGSLSRDLAGIFEDQDLADCTLHVAGRSFQAHKVVLSARSPVFKAMFGHEQTKEAKSSQVNLEDVSAKAVHSMLEFVYSGHCSSLEERPAEILAAADKYCLDCLKQMCETELSRDFSLENICERLRMADSYSAAMLRTRALRYVRQHKNAVRKSQEWLELKRECPAFTMGVLEELLDSQDEA